MGKSGHVQDKDQSSKSPDTKELYQRLVAQFDLEELAALCFDLDIDFEDIKGSGKSAKARELVLFMERRGRLQELHDAIQLQRD